MSELEIVVRGNARGRYAPERGVIDIAVHLEGPVKSAVYESAVTLHSRITDALGELEAAGAVNRWTAESVRVYSYRPYTNEGESREPMYNTRIRLDAEFGDFEKLSEFIDTWSGEEGVTIDGVRWDVHEASRRAHERELRREAVEDAIAKAQAYSDAVGRGPVTPTLLSDPDMVDHVASPRARLMGAAVAGSAPSLELRADDIEIDVAVDARFRAE
ncbi:MULTISPECIES: SIMPL domain-containing protein [Gordonia]|uniref:SIMPL domain-containing protein n=1 Tax=Gordonia amicalis TaxID=89053 RepID=A0ABU4DK66_9ACTN|nr:MULTISPECIES: SIMPL domain-containing protein [Gordonia]ATD70028.1 SIMPL domain-containing protein [Gordonia sp. 1D]MCZ4578904.1 SIMPL domain-containing protein [Gordonia amicalis]MDJ0455082.1 SIMPL domain-containing protein [Gordonia amicalis]MDV6310145.1 SIMPL domain-containing protein [Gordonia amicalis]MDV7078848.1 SIMPL domain-containing protein [Gordonia amicalis]